MPIAQIDTLSDAQIEEMLADDAKLTAFVKTLPYVQDYLSRAETVNRLQSEVDGLNRRCSGNPQTAALRSDVDKKRAELQQKTEKKRQKEGELSSSALFDKLDAAAKAMDNECEEISAQFLSGDMTPQDFAKKYKEKRVKYHMRSAKKESILHNM